MKQNVHRIGERAFEHNGKTVIVIEDIEFDMQIIMLEHLIAGEFKIICIDRIEDEEYCDAEFYVFTNIPWVTYANTPNPNIKYLNRDNLN